MYPNSRLKRVAKEIDFSKTSVHELETIVRKMHGALLAQDYGDKLGIAAPQLGINKRIMIVQGVVIVNPEWKPVTGQDIDIHEACYSVPKRMFRTSRAKYGWAKWYSIYGEPREMRIKGTSALIFQHELDHLNGVCCIDHGTEVDMAKAIGESSRTPQS